MREQSKNMFHKYFGPDIYAYWFILFFSKVDVIPPFFPEGLVIIEMRWLQSYL